MHQLSNLRNLLFLVAKQQLENAQSFWVASGTEHTGSPVDHRLRRLGWARSRR